MWNNCSRDCFSLDHDYRASHTTPRYDPDASDGQAEQGNEPLIPHVWNSKLGTHFALWLDAREMGVSGRFETRCKGN